MNRRALIMIGAVALAALYSCTVAATDSAEQAGLGSATAPGSGSGSSAMRRFAISHYVANMSTETAANARIDLLLADDLGGIAALGYSGCAFEAPTVSRTTWTSPISIPYYGEGTAGSLTTTLAFGYVGAQIACTSGPTPPPETGPGSDQSSEGPAGPPVLDAVSVE
jgi:hypothetical protein